MRSAWETAPSHLRRNGPRGVEEVRALSRPLAAFSEEIAEKQTPLKDFLFERMYRHHKVNRMMSQARRIVRELFTLFLAEPEVLPSPWRDRADAVGEDIHDLVTRAPGLQVAA